MCLLGGLNSIQYVFVALNHVLKATFDGLAFIRFERCPAGRPGREIRVGIDVQKLVRLTDHDCGGNAGNVFADIGITDDRRKLYPHHQRRHPWPGVVLVGDGDAGAVAG